MKRLNYILILLVSLSILLVQSCGEDNSNDTTPPKVANVRFNVNDTLELIHEGKNIIIELNDSIHGSLETDTVVIGKRLRFRGLFTDDQSLSTAYFHIWGDTVVVNNVDTAYNMKKLMPLYMFGQTEYNVDSMGIILVDPLPVLLMRRGSSVSLKVRESSEITPTEDQKNYEFSIKCTDAAGNEDVSSYFRHPINLYHRKTIIDGFRANPSAFRYRDKPTKPRI